MINVVVTGSALTRTLVSACVIAALISCASPSQKFDDPDAVKLTGAEIRTMLEGNTLTGKDYQAQQAKYADYQIYYPEYGEMRISSADFQDSGKWWVVDDQYCRQWEKGRSGEEKCWTFYQSTDNRVHWVDAEGFKTDDATIENGNSANL